MSLSSIFRRIRSASIFCIDSHVSHTRNGTCVYAIKTDSGESALFHSGSSFSPPLVQQRLQKIGIETSELKHIFVSHLQANACESISCLSQMFPEATIRAHPFAISNLLANKDLPNFDQFVKTKDEDKFTLGDDLTLKVIHTPGPSIDHISLVAEEPAIIFAGESLGSRYDYIAPNKVFVNSSEPTFDLEQLLLSVEKISKLSINTLALSHFGFHDDVEEHSAKCLKWIFRMKEIILQGEDPRDDVLHEFQELYGPSLNSHWKQFWKDVSENARGLNAYSLRIEKK